MAESKSQEFARLAKEATQEILQPREIDGNQSSWWVCGFVDHWRGSADDEDDAKFFSWCGNNRAIIERALKTLEATQRFAPMIPREILAEATDNA